MTGHDELCPVRDDPARRARCGVCDLIAKIRADERDKTMRRADIRAAIGLAVAAERERIAQAIEAMDWWSPLILDAIRRSEAARIARNGGPG